MAEEAKEEDSRWGKMQDNIDMLFSKLESHEATEHQMAAQLDITT
jgi:hypothetical protein